MSVAVRVRGEGGWTGSEADGGGEGGGESAGVRMRVRESVGVSVWLRIGMSMGARASCGWGESEVRVGKQ